MIILLNLITYHCFNILRFIFFVAQDNKVKTNALSENVKQKDDIDASIHKEAAEAKEKEHERPKTPKKIFKKHKESEQESKTKADAKKLIKDVERLQENLLAADSKALSAESNETIAMAKSEEPKEAEAKTDKKTVEEKTNEEKLSEEKPAADEKTEDKNKLDDENYKPVENAEDVNKNGVEKEADTSGDGKLESSSANNLTKDIDAISDEAWTGKLISSSHKANKTKTRTVSFNECPEGDAACESINGADDNSLVDVISNDGVELVDPKEEMMHMLKSLREEKAITCLDVPLPMIKANGRSKCKPFGLV